MYNHNLHKDFFASCSSTAFFPPLLLSHAYKMAACLLKRLTSKKEVDHVIKRTEDKVLILRFGEESHMDCLKLDDIVSQRICSNS